MHDERFYRHSGQFSLTGLVIGLTVTSIVGSALAFIYAYALIYIPLIYINALLTLGFGIALGFIAAGFISLFKIRNTRQACIMTFLGVLAAYYMVWVFWMIAHIHGELPNASAWALAKHPGSVWRLMLIFNENGTWSLGRHSSTPVTGIFLALIWIAEAGMIFGGAFMTIFGRLRLPFCEQCQNWCEERKAVVAVSAKGIEALKQGLVAKNWSALGEAGPHDPLLGTWCTVDLHGCASCGQTNTLTLNSVTVTTDKKGREKKENKILVDRLLLEVEETQSLLAECERLKSPPAEPEVPATETDADQTPKTESAQSSA
jgi:hypothetical protein